MLTMLLTVRQRSFIKDPDTDVSFKVLLFYLKRKDESLVFWCMCDALYPNLFTDDIREKRRARV